RTSNRRRGSIIRDGSRSRPDTMPSVETCQAARALLPRRGGHRGGVMVHDHPVLAVLYEREAIARGQSLGFAVLDVGERVVAGVDSGIAIHADELFAERDLETWQDLER